MRLVCPDDARPILDWLRRVHGIEWINQPSWLFGAIDDDGVLRGVIALELRNTGSGEFHVWGKVSNDVAKEIFRIIFHGFGWHRIECRIARRHKGSRKAARKWGWQFEGIARDYFGPGNDGFQFGMTAAQCRWIRGQTHGQITETAGGN